MNYSKLNELAAKVMGYRIVDEWIEEFKSNIWWKLCEIHEWNPSTCADDALMLLEKMLPENWTLKHQDNGYFCWDEPMSEDSKYMSHAETAPLAMTLCALGAAGIPESEITAAME